MAEGKGGEPTLPLTLDISPVSEMCFAVMRLLGFMGVIHLSALTFTPSFVG